MTTCSGWDKAQSLKLFVMLLMKWRQNFSPEQAVSSMDYFFTKYRIPGVIGCVDGTHIGLQRPSKKEHMFSNRKGYHSLNAMMICEHEYTILVLNSKYGGAAHDPFVWRHSAEKCFLEDLYRGKNFQNGWILGDSGYPLEPWLLTPYRNPEDGSMEAYFNEIHSKTRSIGILKARWKILINDRRSRYTPEKMAQFINVCVALHNICIKFNVPNYTQNAVAETSSTIPDVGNETQMTKIGQKVRDHIKLYLWINK